MASRAKSLFDTLWQALLGPPSKAPATGLDPNLNFTDSAGQSITAEQFKDLLTVGVKGVPTSLAALLKLPASTLTQGLLQPALQALVSAFSGVLLLSNIAQITGEVPYLRPLRKAFSPQQLPPEQLIDAWRRGALTREILVDQLKEIGLSDADIETVLRATESVPGPQDVIRFAVREVYTPATREKFQQDEGVEEVIKNAASDLAAAGLTADTLRKFWAAHWELPSISQGFEMLHRGVITEVEMDTLLRALDVMPFWRDRIKRIAFTVLTRVDIRRMYKLGLLTDERLHRAHLDLGYTEADATLLDAFTRKTAQEPESQEETFSDREASRQRDLSLADVLSGMVERLITPEKALQALTGLGYTKAESDYLIKQKQLEARIKQSAAAVASLHTGFVSGVYDNVFITRELSALGFPASEIEERLKLWTLEAQARIALPSRADVLRWFKTGRITQQRAEQILGSLGLPEEFVKIYVDENLPKEVVPT